MRYRLLSLVLCLGFLLAGCGAAAREIDPNSPQGVTEAAFQAMQTQDAEAMVRYWGNDQLDIGAFFPGTGDSGDFMNALMQHFTYEILSAEENGDTATVKVSLTNIDMTKVMEEFLVQAVAQVKEYQTMPDAQIPGSEEISTQFMKLLTQLMSAKDAETVTRQAEVDLIREHDNWVIRPDGPHLSSLLDAMFGDLFTALDTMNRAFGE